jgi:hypothetical protein
LLDVDGFGQDKVCANAKRLGDPCLTLHYGYRK